MDLPIDPTTLIYEVADHVATVTLNRPEAMNSFNQTMLEEFSQVWRAVREDDDVHAVVLRAAGERAFSTGIDVRERMDVHPNPWSYTDPGEYLSPKLNRVWKPVVTCVQGMAAGGAFYWINESDIVICSEDATFFDPHLTYGLTAALEPIGLARRVPLGEALRVALLGLDERMSARRALQVGLVTEVLPKERLWERGAELAGLIAAKRPAAVQATVRAIWESLDDSRTHALRTGMNYAHIGNIRDGDPFDPAATRPGGWTLR